MPDIKNVSPQVEISQLALDKRGHADIASTGSYPVDTVAPIPTDDTRHSRGAVLPSTAIDRGGFGFPRTGFVRIHDVLAPRGPICISKSGWWAGVKIGRFPKPVKLSPRVTAWRVEDILKLIEDVPYDD